MTADEQQLPTPKEHKSQLGEVGVYLKAETHVSKQLEITGTSIDGEPQVSVTITSHQHGMDKSAVSMSFDPERAGELAEEVASQAKYAERWAEFKKREERGDEGDDIVEAPDGGEIMDDEQK